MITLNVYEILLLNLSIILCSISMKRILFLKTLISDEFVQLILCTQISLLLICWVFCAAQRLEVNNHLSFHKTKFSIF